uniref:uncharacterized protein LOC114674789 n=1 Tax=Macaca mulatta TaxID=9544 RepID=UPI0010A234FD|nr:uncharacterized protein LOC114674789 [Macaca mulatta]
MEGGYRGENPDILPPPKGRTTTSSGRNHHPQPCPPIPVTHPTPAVDDGLAPGQTTPPVPGGGRRGPGAAILELSFRSGRPARARQPLQKPSPPGSALTCHAATATAASILGLSSCFLTESAFAVSRTLVIGSAVLILPLLLDQGHVCQGKTNGIRRPRRPLLRPGERHLWDPIPPPPSQRFISGEMTMRAHFSEAGNTGLTQGPQPPAPLCQPREPRFAPGPPTGSEICQWQCSGRRALGYPRH